MFGQKCKELFDGIQDHNIMCLATSKNNIVTARSMSVIVFEQKFYFQTDINLNKYEQIKDNPNVALSDKNIQIEGICNEIGHPLTKKNSFFANLFEKNFSGSFDAYSSLKDERLFEVIPTKITVWGYDDGNAYQEFYDFANTSYQKKYYLI